MGKKRGKNRKGKNKLYDLTQHEFAGLVCTQCNFCKINGGSNIDFCYHHNYIDDPYVFINKTLENLKQFNEWLITCGYTDFTTVPDNEIQHILENAFCPNCKFLHKGQQCDLIFGCLAGFRKQFRFVKFASQRKYTSFKKKDNRGRKEKNKQKNKQSKQKKVEPYFFCSDTFREQIEELLDGNNPREQDKIEERTRNIETTIDTDT